MSRGGRNVGQRVFAGMAALVALVSASAASPFPSPPTLTLRPVPRCVVTPTVDVRVDLSGATSPVVGGQYFIRYDNSILSFNSVLAGSPPFTLLIYQSANNAAGEVDLATGIPGGGPGTAADTTMAVIRFNVLNPECGIFDLASFRTHNPPTRLTDSAGTPISPDLVAIGRMIIDGAPLHACRVDLDVNGRIEPVDVALFVQKWFDSLTNHTLDGDFDGNLAVEPADVATFVNAWFAAIQGGC